ncbi:TonB-dependent receptor [Dyadobacter bucti]|uniref:TonB-dependent receptor n=1 Tax=Dyadobacter bucti TaxID=2572203 RepID=UPI003F6F70B5
MKKLFPLFLFIFVCSASLAQPVQTVRGRVLDKEAKYPLVGVTVRILAAGITGQGDVTDAEGYFRILKVPVGRQSLILTLVGYKEIFLNNIPVEAGKEFILNLEMEESVTELQMVTVKAKKNGEASNEMAVASARQFSVEETGRYAGSRGEPARMASNFAGVQGADDSRNDIVIRGNAPSGLLWRMEGITIPNPNHFAEAGSSGGPVSIINNKYLANSDFFTGAFPAEFGNTVSGVFDLKLRNGNNEKYETAAQFGFLGTELTSEGPISKNNKSSYLVTGRYANLWLFKKLGIDIGTAATPSYADGFLRMNFPLRQGNLAFWALGGASAITILSSTQTVSDRNIFGQNDRDQHYASNMKVAGATYSHSFNKSLFFKSTVAISNNVQDSEHGYLFLQKDHAGHAVVENDRYRIDSIRPMLDFRLSETRYSVSAAINKKWGARSTLRAGLNADIISFTGIDSVRIFELDRRLWSPWNVRSNVSGQSFANLQPFIQYRRYLTENLSVSLGVTSFLSFANSKSKSWAEPRGGLSWELPRRQKLTFSAGFHSQSLPTYLYAYRPAVTSGVRPFSPGEVGLTKSIHVVVGYARSLGENMRLLSEIYYQHLFNVPVTYRTSSFSILNAVDGANRLLPEALVNTGKGRNYGMEVTLEKFFSNNYSFLLTTSIFNAKYRGTDMVWRNTNVNGRFAVNTLFSREFVFKKRKILNIGAKFTATGGRWYGIVDSEASRLAQDIVYEDATRNSRQFRPYNRFDIKMEYKINRNRLTHTIAVDLVNVLGMRNLLNLSYMPEAPHYRQEYQLGFLPLFFYRIDF